MAIPSVRLSASEVRILDELSAQAWRAVWLDVLHPAATATVDSGIPAGRVRIGASANVLFEPVIVRLGEIGDVYALNISRLTDTELDGRDRDLTAAARRSASELDLKLGVVPHEHAWQRLEHWLTSDRLAGYRALIDRPRRVEVLTRLDVLDSKRRRQRFAAEAAVLIHGGGNALLIEADAGVSFQLTVSLDGAYIAQRLKAQYSRPSA